MVDSGFTRKSRLISVMSQVKPKSSTHDPARQEQMLAKLRRDQEIRQTGYRERALRLFPHVCASCGREFTGKRLKELTVHHKDHNHQNNPSDGSNWELLCLYCHDHEHEKYKLKGYVDGLAQSDAPAADPIANPFDQLDDLLKPKSDDQGNEP
jgi:HNH endonuclease